MHVRLDKEIKTLTANFTEQLNQALNKLTRVFSELNSSKTDRKTLENYWPRWRVILKQMKLSNLKNGTLKRATIHSN